MKEKIIIIGSPGAGVAARLLAEKMNITVVTAEEANLAFSDLPTFSISNNRILDLNDSVAEYSTYKSGGLSKRAARRKAERDAKKKKRKHR